jgi:hypothetical protein
MDKVYGGWFLPLCKPGKTKGALVDFLDYIGQELNIRIDYIDKEKPDVFWGNFCENIKYAGGNIHT